MKQLFTILILIVISSTIGVNDMQSQEIKANKCIPYFDTIVEKWIHVNYEIPPKLSDGKNITHILDKMIIPKDFLDENGEFVYIVPFSLVIIIDADGKVLSYEMSARKKHEYTAYDKIVIRAFETEMQWIPAQCGGVNVASKHWLPLNIHHHIE